MTQTMTTQELASWLNEGVSYMRALASYPITSTGDEYVADQKEAQALWNAVFAMQEAATRLIHLRVEGVRESSGALVIVKSQGGVK